MLQLAAQLIIFRSYLRKKCLIQICILRTLGRMRKKRIVKLLVSCLLAGSVAINSAWANQFDKFPIDTSFIPNNMTNYNLWSSLKSNFQLLPFVYPQDLRQLIGFYLHQRDYLHLMLHNSKPYIYYIYQQTLARHMPAEIALIPMIESAYDPFVYSRVGATGLWQMMPGTASGFGIKINWWYDGRRNVITSTKAALDYLEYLHNFFHDWLLAIAAYDSGEGTILQAIRHNQALGRRTDFWDLPLPYETRAYVPKLLALAAIISNPGYYRVSLPALPNQSPFTPVTVHHQVALDQLAKLTHTDPHLIRELNPAFRRSLTPPKTPIKLLVPTNKYAVFEHEIKQISAHPILWQKHRVASGESLSTIAQQYHTTVNKIENANHLNDSHIKINQVLTIPGKYAVDGMAIHTTSSIVSEAKLPGPQPINITILAHDTLSTIAKRYHVQTREIRYWNDLSERTQLHPQQKLVLWLPASRFKTRDIVYHVKAHDTLSQIAAKFGTSTHTLARVNHIQHNLIHPHQALHIPHAKTYEHSWPKPISRQNDMLIYHTYLGDTLAKVADHYGISVQQLAIWNHLHLNASLVPDERLLIYPH